MKKKENKKKFTTNKESKSQIRKKIRLVNKGEPLYTQYKFGRPRKKHYMIMNMDYNLRFTDEEVKNLDELNDSGDPDNKVIAKEIAKGILKGRLCKI